MKRRALLQAAAVLPVAAASVGATESERDRPAGASIITYDAGGAPLTLALIIRSLPDPTAPCRIVSGRTQWNASAIMFGVGRMGAFTKDDAEKALAPPKGVLDRLAECEWFLDRRVAEGAVYFATRLPHASESAEAWRERAVLSEITNLDASSWLRSGSV